ncbi:DNA repair protein RecN [Sphingobacterium sp. Mn56C]|uniref:DNA repair protein RecN n=1 Tax=Sphingobacterium sp. Mn56C TaxID=3395261 RepID=UPI003BD2133A
MLAKLHIKNYALIDTLDIAFDKGLNIITGETGAGKSILMGALGLILGNRVEGKPFFDVQKKCIIEATFDIRSYALQDFFTLHDLDFEAETIIRREIAIDGKSRAFVNDSPVTLATLKSLGERLIDIHSQHATLQINTESFQLFVLDSLADNIQLLHDFQQKLKTFKQAAKNLKNAQEELAAANAELDYNRFLYEELERVNPYTGEVAALEIEQQQLENAEDIKRSLHLAGQGLADAEQNVLSMLKDSIQQVHGAGKYLHNASALAERLQSSYIEIKDVANEISDEESRVNLDEQRLDEVNNRLSAIYSLLKKHRLDTDVELLQFKEQLEEKLQFASNQDALLDRLEQELQLHRELLLKQATLIHNKRLAVVPVVEKSVATTLEEVGMPNAQLKISLDLLDINAVTSTGLDTVQFLFSANKGQPLQHIHKVASGGELSRVMLAIKSLVAKSSALPTIVFDEIDTGISGEVALRVGEVMAALAQNMQVVAISHLPQIASKGKAHFKVYKEDKQEKTQSNLVLLTAEQRVVEIAQMLSGKTPGEAALQHARELLK